MPNVKMPRGAPIAATLATPDDDDPFVNPADPYENPAPLRGGEPGALAPVLTARANVNERTVAQLNHAATVAQKRAEMEARAGVESLDDLQRDRRKLVMKAARLRARFADGGTWKEHRDALYALLDVAHRDRLTKEYDDAVRKAEAEKEGSSTRVPKVTEKRVEAAVRSDEKWTRALDGWDEGKIALQLAEDDIKQYDERVFARRDELRFAASEVMGG